MAACAISAFSGDTVGAALIAAIVVASIALDFVQSYRAAITAEKLAFKVAITTTVIRDGKASQIPVIHLVMGDVVLVSAGNVIPADGKVIEANDFFINQAQLTGEPYPVEKFAITSTIQPSQITTESWDINAGDTVCMGSSVVSGSATIQIVQTGSKTLLGQIASGLHQAAPATAFETGIRRFGMLIMRLTVLLVLFTLLVNVALARPILESFLFAVALAVGLTPELLPMIVSVTLMRGSMRLAALDVIVKRPSALQDIGTMDVFCTDKTGTLTEARIHLERHIDPEGQDSEKVLELAYLNSYFESGLKSPLDDAILAHGTMDASGWKKIDEVPFDFERRRVSVLLEKDGTRKLLVKGAPEEILSLCPDYQSLDCTSSPITPLKKHAIQKQCDALGLDGYRVLGVAWRDMPHDHPHAVVSDESCLVFAGFAAFLDPPKPSAAHALGQLQDKGVSVKILTGDNELVTHHICHQLGITILGTLTGHDIDLLHDDALQAKVVGVNLFCRVNPAQKNRIILALKAQGHVVGYLGDGINDAPSLHTADVGISFAEAVDIARQSADIILIKNDLAVLNQAVLEGRRTFGNVMKYIMMATSSNFGNMFSMAAATLFLPFMPMLPVQVLLNNLLYDISEIALPLDTVDAADMLQPQRWDMGFVKSFMLAIGSISSVFDFFTFYVLLHFFNANEGLFQTGWFVESMASQVLVIFVIRTRARPWQSTPNQWLTISACSIACIAAALPFTPVAHSLGFTPLPTNLYIVLMLLVTSYLMVVELAKRRFYARHRELINA